MGPDWIHEVEFDGWRTQIHVVGDEHGLYSKKGADLTQRFGQLGWIARAIPAKDAIIDCELMACDDTGMPSFRSLMDLGNRATLVLVAFDLLHLNGVRLTPIPINERKAILQTMVARIGSPYLQFSEAFDDPVELLQTCEKMAFEGIVSKRRESSYRSGPTRDWLKIKTAAWRLSNQDRGEMFQKSRN